MVFVLVCAAPCSSAAQPAGAAGAPPAPAAPSGETTPAASEPSALQAPQLLTFVEADYPAAAREAGLEASVALRLSIDAAGHVTEVEVLEPAGNGFDEAARAAVARFVFAPAQRASRPIASRIRYVYEFRLPAAAAGVQSEPASAAETRAQATAPVAVAPNDDANLVPSPSPLSSSSDPVLQSSAATPNELSAAAVVVNIRGQSNEQRLRESAQAVTVIDTAQAKLHSGDVADVLTRTEGVTIQRSGGLGSQARLSLHGLTDDQIRVFLDGVPLEFSGFGLGISGIPLNWIDRIAVYRGVVPVRFGTDALGGAIDLNTDANDRGSRASASYSAGAFDTHSFALNARTFHAPTGLLARVAGFYDRSRNDYVVRARVPDEFGQPRPASVRRFHDGYSAGGGMLELGVVERPWARRLLLRAFATSFDKDLQHNLFMTVPYGAVAYGQTIFGGTVRYELPHAGGSPFSVYALAGFSHRELDFRDRSRWIYDWFGTRVFQRPPGAGELGAFATDLTQWEQRAIARLTVSYDLAPGHTLRLVSAPDFTARTGRERLRVNTERLDPLTTTRQIFQLVSGFEYNMHVLNGRLENSAFLKHYFYQPSTNQVEVFSDTLRHIDESFQRFGAGDAARVRFAKGVLGKVSYEYATRLPRPDEVFGDGALITPNATLQPESSHNGNLGLQLTRDFAQAGDVAAEITGFVRQASDMIVRLPAADRVHARFENIVDVSSRGVDGSVRWSSPKRWLDLNVNGTWLDIINVSTSGRFAQFNGWRLPNRPWLIANASVSVHVPRFAADNAELTTTWSSHYVHAFQPGWEGNDVINESGMVPMQLVHNLSVVYSVRGTWGIDLALDLTNLSDARVYDVLGVQKPGRAAYFKITGCWACESSAK